MKPYERIPRGLIAGTTAAIALAWALYLLAGALAFTVAQTVFYLANVALSCWWRDGRIALVRRVQRFVVNPLVRALFRIGVNPLGLVLLETRGRVSGEPRVTPVGNGRRGDVLWIIAEHGVKAGYVRNILGDPGVRVRVRVGLRYRWIDGVAEVLPHDDPLARQRQIARWHPLRAFNAMNVRVLGGDLMTVRVALARPGRASDAEADETRMPEYAAA